MRNRNIEGPVVPASTYPSGNRLRPGAPEPEKRPSLCSTSTLKYRREVPRTRASCYLPQQIFYIGDDNSWLSCWISVVPWGPILPPFNLLLLALDSHPPCRGGFMITCASSPLHEELSKVLALVVSVVDGQNIHESAAFNTHQMGMSQKPMRSHFFCDEHPDIPVSWYFSVKPRVLADGHALKHARVPKM